MTRLPSLIAASSLFVVAIASAAQNPLDPSSYQGQPVSVVPDQAFERYVDATNPLQPTYASKIDRNVVWQGTAQSDSEPYRDVHNPLNPSYRGR